MSLNFQCIVRLYSGARALAIDWRSSDVTSAIGRHVVNVVRRPRLRFGRIFVLYVRSYGVRGALRVAGFVSLLGSWFHVGSFLQFSIQVEVGTGSAGVLTRMLFVSEQVAMALSRTNASGAMVDRLVVWPYARSQARQGFNSRSFDFNFAIVVVRPVVFNACANECARAVPRTLVMLRRDDCVVAFMCLVRCDKIVTSVFRNCSNDSLYATFPFLVRLMIRMMVRILVDLYF